MMYNGNYKALWNCQTCLAGSDHKSVPFLSCQEGPITCRPLRLHTSVMHVSMADERLDYIRAQQQL